MTSTAPFTPASPIAAVAANGDGTRSGEAPWEKFRPIGDLAQIRALIRRYSSAVAPEALVVSKKS